ncbi:MAG: hypothetical protein JWR35_1698 [Marmoricola sp.]|nr:hypothetical protein [Marmoricola sp.]
MEPARKRRIQVAVAGGLLLIFVLLRLIAGANVVGAVFTAFAVVFLAGAIWFGYEEVLARRIATNWRSLEGVHRGAPAVLRLRISAKAQPPVNVARIRLDIDDALRRDEVVEMSVYPLLKKYEFVLRGGDTAHLASVLTTAMVPTGMPAETFEIVQLRPVPVP